jgi:hypothetical protein
MFDFSQQLELSNKIKKRLDIGESPPPVSYEGWIVSITAGHSKWNDSDTDKSNLLYCDVGGWDNSYFWDFIGVETDTPESQVPYITSCQSSQL